LRLVFAAVLVDAMPVVLTEVLATVLLVALPAGFTTF
jgi:hypothetical protein